MEKRSGLPRRGIGEVVLTKLYEDEDPLGQLSTQHKSHAADTDIPGAGLWESIDGSSRIIVVVPGPNLGYEIESKPGGTVLGEIGLQPILQAGNLRTAYDCRSPENCDEEKAP